MVETAPKQDSSGAHCKQFRNRKNWEKNVGCGIPPKWTNPGRKSGIFRDLRRLNQWVMILPYTGIESGSESFSAKEEIIYYLYFKRVTQRCADAFCIISTNLYPFQQILKITLKILDK